MIALTRCEFNLFDAPAAQQVLRARLGSLPRRLGGFAELALAGALTLEPPPVRSALILVSPCGPIKETRSVLADLLAGEPTMPVGFMQTQPAITLSVLAAQWAFVERSTCLISGPEGWLQALELADNWVAEGFDQVLIGWVDPQAGVSDWASATCAGVDNCAPILDCLTAAAASLADRRPPFR